MNKRNAKGAVVVELAVSLPVLLLVIFGTLEICNMIKLKQSLTIAAYEGAIISTIPGATASDIQQASQQVLTDRGVNMGNVVVSPSNFQSQPSGTAVTVTANAMYSQNSVVLSGIFGTMNTQAKVVFMKDLD